MCVDLANCGGQCAECVAEREQATRARTMPPFLDWRGTAYFSSCDRHRYELRRWVGHYDEARWLVWCMLNPSTAAAFSNDPTIRKVMGFTWRFGFTGCAVINLFSWRATEPRDCLANLADASNNITLSTIRIAAEGRDVVCAWGAQKWARDQATYVLDHLIHAGARMHHLGLSKDGMPRHPLMLPYSTPLQRWDGGA